jgi:hypothetical protein
MNELDQNTPRQYPSCFSIVAECGDGNCRVPVELIAIRSPNTAEEQMLAEIQEWNLDGFLCENGHQVMRPEPKKSS